MTDLDLQIKLAKLLPEKLRILVSGENFVVWNHEDLLQCRNVLESEWLHICWLIRCKLTLPLQVGSQETWQEQAEHIFRYLDKVKGEQ